MNVAEKTDMGPFAGMDAALERAITGYGTSPYRGTVRVSVRDVGNYSFDDLPTTFEGWLEWLTEAHNEVPQEYMDSLQYVLNYESGHYDSGDSASFSIWYERPETDAEMTERVNLGIAYIRDRQNQERATYESLKRKYESGNR